MHCLVFTDTDLYSLTKGKAYLANQRWRRSTCLRDQCYDVGCHPCNSGIWNISLLINLKNKKKRCQNFLDLRMLCKSRSG